LRNSAGPSRSSISIDIDRSRRAAEEVQDAGAAIVAARATATKPHGESGEEKDR